MNLGLNGQLALITGSTRGIGRGIAEAFLEEGARVIITGRNQADLQATLDQLENRFGAGRARGFAGDLRQPEAVERLGEFIQETWGKLDHLICNLGSGRSVPPLQEDEAEWRRQLDINLLAATAAVRILLPLLEKQAQEVREGPSIIFISSICGLEVLGCPVAYAAAKSALTAYAQNIARPLAKRGIRVNVVTPGNVIFPGSTWEEKLSKSRENVEAMLRQEVPLGRLGTVAEIAQVVAFLASRCASFVTGANWVVDGGQTRSR